MEHQSHRDTYKAVVRIIDSQRRMLADANADAKILDGLANLVRYLHRLPGNQIDRMFGVRELGREKEAKTIAIREAANFSLDQVESVIESVDSSRTALEAIAIGRFHVPKGSMRSLGNLERLKDKLRTFVQNERTHVTITELAQRQ